MSAPRRWLDDPETDEALRELLRGAEGARPLDSSTRRRLGAKVARASAVPAAAAGWLFVKSAAAALGVVLGGGALAVSAGVVDWSPRVQVQSAPARAPRLKAPLPAPPPAAPSAPEVVVEEPPAIVVPAPVPPVVSAAGSLSAEAALLELARREMRSAPALALSFAADHAQRFPRGQLAAERTLIQIEALHRLGRDAEARALSRSVLGGPSAGLYAERIHWLLGESAPP